MILQRILNGSLFDIPAFSWWNTLLSMYRKETKNEQSSTLHWWVIFHLSTLWKFIETIIWVQCGLWGQNKYLQVHLLRITIIYQNFIKTSYTVMLCKSACALIFETLGWPGVAYHCFDYVSNSHIKIYTFLYISP